MFLRVDWKNTKVRYGLSALLMAAVTAAVILLPRLFFAAADAGRVRTQTTSFQQFSSSEDLLFGTAKEKINLLAQEAPQWQSVSYREVTQEIYRLLGAQVTVDITLQAAQYYLQQMQISTERLGLETGWEKRIEEEIGKDWESMELFSCMEAKKFAYIGKEPVSVRLLHLQFYDAQSQYYVTMVIDRDSEKLYALTVENAFAALPFLYLSDLWAMLEDAGLLTDFLEDYLEYPNLPYEMFATFDRQYGLLSWNDNVFQTVEADVWK